MSEQQLINVISNLVTNLGLLVPLAVFITVHDVKYRKIPNIWVLVTLVGGLLKNAVMGGWVGALSGIEGFALAFCLMLPMHLFGALGAGDVKLFSAIGAVIGVDLVLGTFVVVVFTGAALAVFSMIRERSVRVTMQRVLMILVGLLPGWKIPRFETPSDRTQTLPYGVAIVFGSLISLAIFRI